MGIWLLSALYFPNIGYPILVFVIVHVADSTVERVRTYRLKN